MRCFCHHLCMKIQKILKDCYISLDYCKKQRQTVGSFNDFYYICNEKRN